MKRRKFLGGVAGLLGAFGVAKAVAEPEKEIEAEVDSQVRALELENGSRIAYSGSAGSLRGRPLYGNCWENCTTGGHCGHTVSEGCRRPPAPVGMIKRCDRIDCVTRGVCVAANEGPGCSWYWKYRPNQF
jgi:hypothetical protein